MVGTPIGNLGDLTLRAASVLASVDAVICEDTRRTGKLLAHIRQQGLHGGVAESGVAGSDEVGRTADLLVANEHTEYGRIPEILERLGRGESLALVTDAGMPTISDPGAAVVAAVVDAGHRVEVVPGPSAVSAALAVAGLPTERYVFEGFLPRKGSERRRRLEGVAGEARTVVLYEAPHRLVRTLTDLADVCGGDRRLAVARELTKLHEEVVRTTLAQARERFTRNEPRGEFVLVLDGRPEPEAATSDDDLRRLLDEELATGASRRDAVAAVVAATGQPKRRVYDLANARPGDGGPEELA